MDIPLIPLVYFVFLTLASITAIVGAHAETPIHAEANFYTRTAGGKPVACGIEFSAIYRDHTYSQGRHAAVVGSVTLMRAGAALAAMLKIRGADETQEGTTPFFVASGFVSTGANVLHPQNSQRCEDQLGLCGVYDSTNTALVMEAILSGPQFLVGFNRRTSCMPIYRAHITLLSGLRGFDLPALGIPTEEELLAAYCHRACRTSPSSSLYRSSAMRPLRRKADVSPRRRVWRDCRHSHI
jgi:hypothetical protein